MTTNAELHRRAEHKGAELHRRAEHESTELHRSAEHKRRRILIVASFMPAPWFGGGTRSYELIRQLAMRHKVTVICPAAAEEEADAERLRSLGVEVQTAEARPPGRAGRRLDQLFSLLSPLPFHVREHRNAAMQE